jgi:hypothetical protein
MPRRNKSTTRTRTAIRSDAQTSNKKELPLVEILLILKGIMEVGAFVTGLANKLQVEGRDPTPAEIDDVHARFNSVTDEWKALLPKPPDA